MDETNPHEVEELQQENQLLRKRLEHEMNRPCERRHYHEDTKRAFGLVVLACFEDDAQKRDDALAYLAKMVGCDLCDEVRGVMSKPKELA